MKKNPPLSEPATRSSEVVSRRDLVSLLGIGAGVSAAAAGLSACVDTETSNSTQQSVTTAGYDTLNTLADLRAEVPTGSDPQTYLVLGYHSVDDGGGGVFYWDGSAQAQENYGTVICPDPLCNLDGGLPASGPPPGRWLRAHHKEGIFNVLHFGAKRNNSDAPTTTAAIKNAFAAAERAPNTNHIVYFPTGVYRWDASSAVQLSQGTQILGAGSAATRIMFDENQTTAYFVHYVDGGFPGWSVRHLGFRTLSPGADSGNIIEVSNTGGQDAVIEDINCRTSGDPENDPMNATKFWNIIRINAGVQNIVLRDIVIVGLFSVAFIMDDCLNIQLSHFLIDGKGSLNVWAGTGLRLRGHVPPPNEYLGIDGLIIESGMITNCLRALHTTGAAPERLKGAVANCKFVSVYFDDSADSGDADCALLDGVVNSVFTDCYFVSAARYGCLAANSHHIYFNGCQFDHNTEHGLRINSSAHHVYVVGGSAKENGVNSSGVWVENGTSGFTIQGVDAKGSEEGTPANAPVVYGDPQLHGITIMGGCTNFSVMNCDLRDNAGSGLLNYSGTGSNKFAYYNLT